MNHFRIKTWFLILTAIIALTISLSADAQEKRFQVSKNGKVDIKLNVGDINLQTWDRNEVLVKYDKHNEDNDGTQLEINQNGNTISIVTGSWGDQLTSVTVPGEFNANVQTYAGNIHLKGNLVGKFEGKSGGGDFNIENINGVLDISTQGGNVKLGFARGTVSIKTSGGDLRTGDIDGDIAIKVGGGNIILGKVSKTVKLKTGGGNIKIAELSGNAVVNTGGGNISVNSNSGNIDLSTGGGDIKVNNSTGEVRAKTNSGRIILGNVMKKVNVYTGAGDADINVNNGYNGNSEIKTGIGSIDIIIPETVKATINAKTDASAFFDEEDQQDGKLDNIKSDYKASKVNKTEDGEVTAVYHVNGGGNTINVNSVNGDISIRKSK